jgi:adenylate kinase family enzyme
MRRVLVLGSSGAGKTVLARRMSALLDIPVVRLDRLYYDHDWQPRPVEELAARQRQALALPGVILDGNDAATLPVRLAVADTVVPLDLPACTCLAGIARRRLRFRGGQHPDGCSIASRSPWSGTRSATGVACSRPCWHDWTPTRPTCA